MTGTEFTAAGTEYTLTDAGTIQLGRSTYRVEVQDYAETGGRTVWLYGARGAAYFLRGFLGKDDGLRQVISWKSGQPLRDSRTGAEVRVIAIGDVIEVAH